MTDLDTLRDAFTELERRADSYDPGQPARASRHVRWSLVAASAAVVVAVGGGVVALASRGDDSGSGPAAGPSTSTSSVTAPSTSSTPSSTVSSSVGPTPTKSGYVPPPTSTRTLPPTSGLPRNAAQLAARLRQILGDSATITYSAIAGAQYTVIGGRITTADGHKGSYDIQFDNVGRGTAPSCEDPPDMKCTTRVLSDGSRAAIGREPTQLQRGGMLYLVNLVRKDGIGFYFHISNEGDPKGGDGLLGKNPPITPQRMIQILQSPLWGN